MKVCMYGECMCEGVHLCRASFRNFVKGGQKLSIENLWGATKLIQVGVLAYQLINFKGGRILQRGRNAPL